MYFLQQYIFLLFLKMSLVNILWFQNCQNIPIFFTPQIHIAKEFNDFANNIDNKYYFDSSEGKLYEINPKNQTVSFLIKMPLDKYNPIDYEQYDFNIDVDKTVNGNLLIELEICNKDIALSFNAYSYHYIWLSQGYVNMPVTIFGNSKPILKNNFIYIAGQDGLFVIDDEKRQIIKKYAPGLLQQCYNLVWANEKYILLNDYNGSVWVLISLIDDEILNLSDILLNQTNKESLIDLANLPEALLADTDSYWQNIGKTELLDPHPDLQFVNECDGILHFRLIAVHSLNFDGNYKYIDIDYKVK